MNFRRIFIIASALTAIAVVVIYIVFIWFGDGPPPPKVPVPPSSTFVERSYPFDAGDKNAKFLMGFMGSDVLKSEIRFSIVSHRGDTLYKNKFASTEMILSDSLLALADSSKTDFLMKQIVKVMDQTAFIPDYETVIRESGRDTCSRSPFLIPLRTKTIKLCWTKDNRFMESIVNR